MLESIKVSSFHRGSVRDFIRLQFKYSTQDNITKLLTIIPSNLSITLQSCTRNMVMHGKKMFGNTAFTRFRQVVITNQA